MKKLLPLIIAVVAVSMLAITSSASAMNKAELIDAIASNSGLSKADSKRALEGFIASTSKAIKKGDRVALVGFGSFSISKRAARTGRNPQTGAEIKIAAKKVVKLNAFVDTCGNLARCATDEDLAAATARKAKISPELGALVVETFKEFVKKHVRAGERVNLRGFGSFVVKKREGGSKLNLLTGETIEIAPRTVVTFKPAKSFASKVKKKDEGRKKEGEARKKKAKKAQKTKAK